MNRLFSTKLKGEAKKWMERHTNDQYVKLSKLVSVLKLGELSIKGCFQTNRDQ